MRSLLFVVGAVCLAACGGNPAAPQPAIPDFAGAWSGTIAVTACTQSGDRLPDDFCAQQTNVIHAFHLTLTQNGRSLSATYDTGNALLGTHAAAGSIGDTGTATIAGTFASPGNTTTDTWHVSLTGTTLAGTMDEAHDEVNGSSTVMVRSTRTILSASRQ